MRTAKTHLQVLCSLILSQEAVFVLLQLVPVSLQIVIEGLQQPVLSYLAGLQFQDHSVCQHFSILHKTHWFEQHKSQSWRTVCMKHKCI